MSFGGPLFELKWLGTLCPCLEKEESRNARQALQHVNTASKRILWNSANSAKAQSGSGFSLGGLFGGGSNKQSAAGSDKNIHAVLCIRDSDEGYPEIYVDPFPDQAVSYKLQIALRRVHSVQLASGTSDDIVLTAKPVGGAKRQAPKELLRFSVLQDRDDDVVVAVPSDQRNLLVHHLSVLVEWERQRRTAAGDDGDEDEGDQPNFLQARAKKAAHFAQRELELQTTKREREKRKAKLVAESGGLKYTALAMANRSDVS
jgi:hypothetical protein